MSEWDMRVGVVGAGYVGLTTAVCLAERGIDTVAVDVDRCKVGRLNDGVATLDEPDMRNALHAGLNRGALRFSADQVDLADRDVVFVCVPTPSAADGAADLAAVDSVVDSMASVLQPGAVVALKSTVPVGTTRNVSVRLQDKGIHAVSAPEFLREGYAIEDFRHPDRVVIGALDDGAADAVCRAYGAQAGPILRTSPESAELAKYASNAFLAVKLSYVNSLAELSDRVGADVVDVTRCMGADPRIGGAFLQPGPGWGGSCLPKDTAALVHTARRYGVSLAEVEASRRTNDAQAPRVAATLMRTVAKPVASMRITVFGLTFKAGTNDTRDSPALAVCAHLSGAGAHVQGYDPRLGAIDQDVVAAAGVTAVDDPYRAAKGADAIVVLTEWRDFVDLDWAAIAEASRDAVVLDTRNLLDAGAVVGAGLRYVGNGRAR
ncbi:MAG: UDP-glucose 6-dehydrogenase [Mycobacterium sp.]|nr:UDP-glucose 6-dehydrogenase [Mycobacterium sp.]MDT5068533.1 UDPglucose 6-dehydrogenase [Mycobacterium sp.]